MKSYTIEELITPAEMMERKHRYFELTNKKGDCYYFFRFKYLSDFYFNKTIKYFLDMTECPICLEKFFNIKNSWITLCGHIFHKKCLYKWEYKTKCNGTCPMCRKYMGTLDFLDGINYSIFPINNYLDLLEESDNLLHQFCYNCENLLGMNKNCNQCKSWQNIQFHSNTSN
jgi:hypothetical protein